MLRRTADAAACARIYCNPLHCSWSGRLRRFEPMVRGRDRFQDAKDGKAAASFWTYGPAVGASLRRRAWRFLGHSHVSCDQLARRGSFGCIDHFYVVIYTIWLKPRTAQNIVIGGAAGAFPPLIGWVAATGHISALPLLLFGIIFLWTPPHFWALSLFVRSDYADAGIPMLPVVSGVSNTRKQIFLYSLPMAAASIAPWPLGLAGKVYGGSALVLNFVFVVLAARVLSNRATEPLQMAPEKKLFAYSVFYLFALFAVLVADRWLRA